MSTFQRNSSSKEGEINKVLKQQQQVELVSMEKINGDDKKKIFDFQSFDLCHNFCGHQSLITLPMVQSSLVQSLNRVHGKEDDYKFQPVERVINWWEEKVVNLTPTQTGVGII